MLRVSFSALLSLIELLGPVSFSALLAAIALLVSIALSAAPNLAACAVAAVGLDDGALALRLVRDAYHA